MPRRSVTNMEAGDRNWRVTLQQRPTEDQADESGAPVEPWTTLVDNMPASKIPVRGTERFTAQQLSASYDTRWVINYRADMDPELVHVAKLRRLKYRNRVYDIVGAEMLGLRQGIELPDAGERRFRPAGHELMATRFSFQMTGWKELAANLRALPAGMQREKILDVLKDAAEPMRARMQQIAPREPGAPDLADNIGISVISRIGDVGGGRWQARHDEEHAVAVGPTKDFFYGIFLEYGTVHMHAQPFMRPAFDGTAQTPVLGLISQGLWDIIRDQRILSAGGRTL